ncbi:MAG: YsnF/AvaK domain-containing protein [Desulfocurvibacter africanus]
MINIKGNTPSKATSADTQIIPVVEEKLHVEKHTLDTGTTRVKKIVHEREEVISEPLLRQEAQISRVPINRYVDQAPAMRQEKDTLIMPVVEEVLVVEKRLLLKEELHITRKSKTIREPQRVVLRSEEAVVEHVDAQAPREPKKR